MNSNPAAVMAAVRGAWTFNLACCGVADISLILLVIALETSSSLMHRHTYTSKLHFKLHFKIHVLPTTAA